MVRFQMLVSLLLVAAVLGGCRKTEQQPKPPAERAGEVTSDGEKAVQQAAEEIDQTAKGDTTAAEDATAAAGKEADALLTKIRQLIKDGKLDEADTQLKTLEAKKDSLPKSSQDEVGVVRQLLKAAQAAAGKIKIPTDVPKLPK